MYLKKVLKEAGYNPKPYSGRGMFGKRCVSINTEMDHWAITWGIARLPNLGLVGPPKFDSLGNGTVIYWPEIAWED